MVRAYRVVAGLVALSLLVELASAKGWTVDQLRAWGPKGLAIALESYDALLAERSKLQKQLEDAALEAETKKETIASIEKQISVIDGRLKSAAGRIDHIGGQRSCTVSRLYWYTDLEQAKAEAEQSGRPILSLRMLGKLTDEYSCANSRFFRTTLYSNNEISQFLRTNFVLHWQSVRPVPRVTIDFGDGRKLERTITGNSAHYVLASDGTPLDVLPGLYSPLAFRQWTWKLRDFHKAYLGAAESDRAAMLLAFHEKERDELLQQWDFDIQRIGAERAELARLRINAALESARLAGEDVPAAVEAPKAAKAFAKAITKTEAEAPVLRFARLGGTWMERGMDEELWKALADLHRRDVKLDEASIELMRREAPPAADAARLAVSKMRVEDPILRLVRAFEDSIALDTVRNKYLLHRKVHERFSENMSSTANVDALNEWVYAELFLTPSNDPWLGLAPRDVYTALDGDGRSEPEEPLVGRAGS